MLGACLGLLLALSWPMPLGLPPPLSGTSRIGLERSLDLTGLSGGLGDALPLSGVTPSLTGLSLKGLSEPGEGLMSLSPRRGLTSLLGASRVGLLSLLGLLSLGVGHWAERGGGERLRQAWVARRREGPRLPPVGV